MLIKNMSMIFTSTYTVLMTAFAIVGIALNKTLTNRAYTSIAKQIKERIDQNQKQGEQQEIELRDIIDDILRCQTID